MTVMMNMNIIMKKKKSLVITHIIEEEEEEEEESINQSINEYQGRKKKRTNREEN